MKVILMYNNKESKQSYFDYAVFLDLKNAGYVERP